ncbi:MAG: DoxX family protein [Deltaproteobacteria bacterium]|nr:DoxX family protein [Deltaproteobacteria bacterium]
MKNLIQKICKTEGGLGLLILRLVLGVIFFKAGTGKLWGWYGGPGIQGAIGFFIKLGIPAPVFHAYFVGCIEATGGVALILGLFTRIVSIPLAITMIVAMLTAHKPIGGEKISMAFYYVLVIFAALAALIDRGAGDVSLDKKIGCCEGCKKT